MIRVLFKGKKESERRDGWGNRSMLFEKVIVKQTTYQPKHFLGPHSHAPRALYIYIYIYIYIYAIFTFYFSISTHFFILNYNFLSHLIHVCCCTQKLQMLRTRKILCLNPGQPWLWPYIHYFSFPSLSQKAIHKIKSNS